MLFKSCFCNLYVFSNDTLKINIFFLFFPVVNKSVFCRIVCTFFLSLKTFYLFMTHSYISRCTHLFFGRTGTESI